MNWLVKLKDPGRLLFKVFPVIIYEGSDIFNTELFSNNFFILIENVNHWRRLHIIIIIEMGAPFGIPSVYPGDLILRYIL